ncbi:hypothetical protein [Nocardia amamiensis]|uniref:hypothetical protein n=1 Tax=Nocardia amamiensis TaxID=404578 RepID=UPI000B036F1C|nr:hypothetical protein [Nocardia amamiensis]
MHWRARQLDRTPSHHPAAADAASGCLTAAGQAAVELRGGRLGGQVADASVGDPAGRSQVPVVDLDHVPAAAHLW